MDKVNVNGENVNELLQAQAHVWNHIFNFINSMSLKCAVDLGIPDIIHSHGQPMTVTELVAALPTLHPTKACNMYRLMRILVHSGFFAQQKLKDDSREDGYVLTTASRFLLKEDPLSQAPLVEALLDPMLTKPWDFLAIWFENNDRTPLNTACGKALWDYDSSGTKLIDLLNKGMASDSQLVISVLIESYKGTFEGLTSLVDVGGNTGTVGKAIADAFPHLECIVFDRPQVVAGLKDSGNFKYVGGNMFEEVPAADAVLLKFVLHGLNDDECLKVLKQCKKAISNGKEGGKVIIIDMVLMKNEKVNEEALNLIETQLFFDMASMTLVGGKEREEEEFAKLFFSAGFSDYKITTILFTRSVIEVFP
ncbi:Trans-resveratrol di-O-methyltransferase [Hibiscus syriacus]|uniref:Trans-resveratrol di-O-methyltransferase n=1 Tax=Hibiscus syriacus TaxID=106335 RepID=A0A6A2YUT3_HIBSY|nr:trans-resveratrol di-O-methyltransferase-like [Hibiscus syriacus]KAE8683228.1 Trans-resveratrol di-O-methyltransferase [Hibiscus syriacus]